MLTREQVRDLKKNDIIDVQIIDDNAPRADKVIDELRGRIVRIIVHQTSCRLIASSELEWGRKDGRMPNPYEHSVCGQALIGENLPAHILRVFSEEDENRGALMGLFDWMIADYSLVSRG